MYSKQWMGALGALLVGTIATAPSVSEAQSCDLGVLAGQLASASPGDVVLIGSCKVIGSLDVPDGVTLRGMDRALSVIEVPIGMNGAVLHAGPNAARLENLTVQSAGRFGILIGGTGDALVRGVTVEASRGVGIGAEDVGAVVLDDVQLTGPVTATNAGSFSVFTSPLVTATHGIVVNRVGDLSADDTDVSGFAVAGALVSNSISTLTDMTVSGNAHIGALLHAGQATLSDVRVRDNFRGLLPVNEQAAALVMTGGVTATTLNVVVTGNDGGGVLQDRTGVVEHTNLTASSNAHAGLWVQRAGYTQLDDAALLGNAWAGIVAVDTTLVSLSDVRVWNTSTSTVAGFPTAGDGVHLSGTPGDLFDTNLTNNQRAGMLASLSPVMTAADYRFGDVRVSGADAASLGIVMQQGGVPLPLVTTGINRQGVTAANDAAFVLGGDILEVTGGVEPCFLPLGDLIAKNGLASLFGQDPREQ